MGYQKRNAVISDRTDPERGANLVEFAILAPLLVILVLGIVEFGWLFGQFNDVRHAAREGARFAAVDAGDNTAIAAAVCSATEGLTGGFTSLEVSLVDGPTSTKRETATITVTAGVQSLSGAPIISSFIPSDLTSEVTFRLEQDSASWSSTPLGSPIDASGLC